MNEYNLSIFEGEKLIYTKKGIKRALVEPEGFLIILDSNNLIDPINLQRFSQPRIVFEKINVISSDNQLTAEFNLIT